MNRQTKRAMKKQEQQRKAPKPVASAPRERTKPRQFLKEVIAELKKVAWPTRHEVFAYTMVVLVAVIVIATLIFGMDFVFTKAILFLFGVDT